MPGPVLGNNSVSHDLAVANAVAQEEEVADLILVVVTAVLEMVLDTPDRRAPNATRPQTACPRRPVNTATVPRPVEPFTVGTPVVVPRKGRPGDAVGHEIVDADSACLLSSCDTGYLTRNTSVTTKKTPPTCRRPSSGVPSYA